MVEITCRCGKSKKRFFQKIGPYYIAECCIDAGFNHLGQSPAEIKNENIIKNSNFYKRNKRNKKDNE